jgi:molybdenum-dependent DNA-binding transcriptional regulator ModE
MPEDPTGIKQALESIPKGQLSERQQRIAAGLSLIRDDGKSIHGAAKAVDVPCTTLWRYAKGLTALESERGIDANSTALLNASFDIAQVAASRITDRLFDEDNPVEDKDLVKFYGVATDKIAIKLGWTRGYGSTDEKTQNALAGALQALREGSSVSITKPDKPSEAIDVTHKSTHDDG